MPNAARKARRGRPRGFESDAALEAAMLTFWEKGYNATSLDDLVARTGASRAGLYKTFGDKRAVFLKALDLYGARFEARAAAVLAEEPRAREAVRRLMIASAERLSGGEAPPGCLRCIATLELMGADAALDAALIEANAHYERVIQTVVDHGVREGQLGKDDADGLARYVTGAVNGMVILARSGTTRDGLVGYVDRAMRAWPSPWA